MNSKVRLLEFIEHLGINSSQFEKSVGLSNGYINNIRKSFGEDSLNKILKKYPELNKLWLLHGDGEMLKGVIEKADVGEQISDLIVTCINQQAEINVMRKVIESLSESASGRSNALISGEMQQAVKMEKDRLRDEFLEKQKLVFA